MIEQVATWARDVAPGLQGFSDGSVVARVAGLVVAVCLGVWDTVRRW